ALIMTATMRERCPCCGYITLESRASFEICQVCFWEDDGQGDEDADAVLGGPNGLLSLSQARRNFREFGAVERRFISKVRLPTQKREFHECELRALRPRRHNVLMLSRVAAPPSSGATRSVAQNEARKRRAKGRRYVGSCNELARTAERDQRPSTKHVKKGRS